MSSTTYVHEDTPISTREDISIWWNRKDRVYDITVREMTWDQDKLIGPAIAEVVYWQTHSYREARTYRWMLINKRDQHVI